MGIDNLPQLYKASSITLWYDLFRDIPLFDRPYIMAAILKTFLCCSPVILIIMLSLISLCKYRGNKSIYRIQFPIFALLNQDII